MRVLFVHQNFPGQYKHLAPAMAAAGHQVLALTLTPGPAVPGVQIIRYALNAQPASGLHPWLSNVEPKVFRGEAAARAALELQDKGFVPDLICAHPGWGEALFLKDVFPQARLLSFFEFHYQPTGADYDFDPEYTHRDFASRAHLRMKNANSLLNLDACDWGISPTRWQWSTLPDVYRSKVSVIHDGIDTELVRPDPAASLQLQVADVTLTRNDEVITFVNRNLEPYRGFHTFMRALPEIQRRRPNAWVLIVGGNEVSYGRALPDGESYRERLLKEVGGRLNMQRIRFLGRIPYPLFVRMLQVSAVHVYLTYPFVLSWSMLEAMAAGCLVVGSATPPVTEVIRDGDNGLLVDFFSPAEIADAVDRVLDHPTRMADVRGRARATVVSGYDLRTVCLPRQLQLATAVAAGRAPAAIAAAGMPAMQTTASRINALSPSQP